MNGNIDQFSFSKQKIVNVFSSLIFLLGMVSILSVLGWVFAGVYGMVWAGIISIIVLTAGAQITPRLVLRLYRARPLSPERTPWLYAVIRKLAQRGQLPMVPTLYYIPTPVMNAFATGSRNNAAIAVTDGLLNELNMRELTAVLAHEVSHLKNNDLWILNLSNSMGRVTSFFSLMGQLLLIFNLPLILVTGQHVSWMAIFVLIMAPTLTLLLQLALSRTREFDADLTAATLTGDPAGLALALQKIERHSAGRLPGLLLPGQRKAQPEMLRTHPNTRERIKRLLSLADDRKVIAPVRYPMTDGRMALPTPLVFPDRSRMLGCLVSGRC